MVDIPQLFGAVGGVGGTVAVISVVVLLKDHKQKDRDRAVSEGRLLEQQNQIKIQVDAAHDKIRNIDNWRSELNSSLSDIRNDLKWIVNGLTRLDEKFDEHQNRER